MTPSDAAPPTALVGPDAARGCPHRVAREGAATRAQWAARPRDEAARLRGEDLRARRAELERVLPPARLTWGVDLPADPMTGRAGQHVELLELVGGELVPLLVVGHRTVEEMRGRRPRPARVVDPATGEVHDRPDLMAVAPLRDLDRLASAWRLLEATGRVAADFAHGAASDFARGAVPVFARGAVIGPDLPAAPGPLVVLHDLTTHLTDEAARHDHAVDLASGRVATAPSRVGECRSCPWWDGWEAPHGRVEGCREQLERRDDVSLVVSGAQARVLRATGVRTVEALAASDTEEVARPAGWTGPSFEQAVTRARARRDRRVLVPVAERPAIPRADVEVDVDMESYQQDGAYLWGALVTVRDGGPPPRGGLGYRPFVSWEPLPGRAEGEVFARFWLWLTAARYEVRSQGRTFRAYCYSAAAENGQMRSAARRFGPDGQLATIAGVPAVDAVEHFCRDASVWTDVHRAVATQFVSVDGFGLKTVAPVAGFRWRDAEPGGLASLGWYRNATDSSRCDADHWRRRLLQYNEDDVRAQRAVREWITLLRTRSTQ